MQPLRWLAHTTPDLNEARAALKKIMFAGNRASEIVDNLRAMFRKESSARRPLDINTLLANVVELTSHEAQRRWGGVHTAHLEGQKPEALGDQPQLEQVFLNLVMNAIEAMSSAKSNRRVLELKTSVNEDGEVLVHELEAIRDAAARYGEYLGLEPGVELDADGRAD